MGMEQRVEFDAAGKPRWADVAALLSQRSFPVEMRMIDGELAFPNEAPPDGWRELRVATPGGMITAVPENNVVRTVTWGNADVGMRQARNALPWACAAPGGGTTAAAP